MTRALPALALVLVGCTQKSAPAPDTAGAVAVDDKKEAKTDEPPPVRSEVPRSHVVLGKHESTEKTAQFLAVDLGQASVMALREVAAAPMPNWVDHTRSVAAHGGGAAFVTQRPADGGWQLVRFDVNEKPGERAVALPGPADGMHLVGEVAFVGIGNAVLRVDFAASAAKAEPLYERELSRFKAYDLFVRSGDLLFAIDDEVSPIYADTFRLQGDGTATHEVGFQLPGVINGVYRAGAYDPGGTLFVLAEYGIMDGHGQDLAALPVEGGKTRHGADVILNSTVSTDPAVLEEHVSRETGKPVKLAAGTEFTPWPSVELAGPASARRLLLPAGKRGLLSVPAAFTPETKADVAFPGTVMDVKVDGARVFVLLPGELVELSDGGAKLEEVRRTALPTTFHRILD